MCFCKNQEKQKVLQSGLTQVQRSRAQHQGENTVNCQYDIQAVQSH